MCIAYIIPIPILLVALNEQAKHLLNGNTMAMKGGARQGYSLAHFCFKPSLVDISQRDGLGMINGIYQPDVFFEFCIGCHASSIFYQRKFTIFLRKIALASLISAII